jgi:hypothetical protein
VAFFFLPAVRHYDAVFSRNGTQIEPRGTSMVIETVEISTPPEESPAVSWAAIAAGAIAAAALSAV